MTEKQSRPAPAFRPVAPAFLLGVGFAFVVCCLLGFVSSKLPLFRGFSRFHVRIGPDSLFYPTANQVRELARESLPREKIAVIVGGNSIFYGINMRPGHVWTERLQELLGDKYAVLHLSMRGSASYEFAGVAAEMMLAEHPRLLFVTQADPGHIMHEPDGAIYRYFFWDAHGKGLLTDDPDRREALYWWRKGWGRTPEGQEMSRRMLLDRYCYFNDLWQRVTYEHVSTVWNYLLPHPFTRPRRLYADTEPGDYPTERRYPAARDAVELKRVRGWLTAGADLLGKAPVSPRGTAVQQAARASFPRALRPRTLVVVTRESPHYVNQLPPGEREDYDRLLRATADSVRRLGFHAESLADVFTADDFNDRCHLDESGAVKMAESVAPMVRQAAVRLGYVPAPPPEGR